MQTATLPATARQQRNLSSIHTPPVPVSSDPRLSLLIPNDYVLLNVVNSVGPVTVRETVKATRLISKVVNTHLVELTKRQLVEVRRIGGDNPRAVYVITPLGASALEHPQASRAISDRAVLVARGAVQPVADDD